MTQDAANYILQAALFYADHMHWSVFPLSPRSKEPMPLDVLSRDGKGAEGSGGYFVATNDPVQITAWWQKFPDANLGVVTGCRSGVIVLDIDRSHGGEQSLLELQVKYGKLPDTLSAKSGGGRHLYYTYSGDDIRNSAGKLGPGLDIRGNGGYIVAPPSVHPNGTVYTWITKPSQVAPASAPDWLVRALSEKLEPGGAHPLAPPVGEQIRSGNRNQTLTSLAGSMRRRGMSTDAIYAALWAENTTKCAPPLSEDEVHRIAVSVSRYTPADPPQVAPDVPEEHASQSQTERVRRFDVRDNLFLDQTEYERLFCAAVFASSVRGAPQAIQSCSWLTPDMFRTPELRKFWDGVLQHGDVMRASTDAGIGFDISRWALRDDVVVLGGEEEYARTIANFNYMRAVHEKSVAIMNAVLGRDVDGLRKAVSELAATNPQATPAVYTPDDIDAEFQKLIHTASGSSIMTGIAELDNILGGLYPTELTILAARPSVGKTALSLQIARNIARRKKRVLYLSLEMSRTQLWARIACGLSGHAWKDVRAGKTDAAGLATIEQNSQRLAAAYRDYLFIQDEVWTVSEIHQLVLSYKPDLVIIDHLGEISWPDKKAKPVEWYGEATKYIRRFIVRGASTHTILVHQLNREVEKRDEKRPLMSDLRQSGELEQLADNVLMMYRDDYYDSSNASSLSEVPTEVWVRKFRQGQLNSCAYLEYDLSHQVFRSQSAVVPKTPVIMNSLMSGTQGNITP